MHQTIIKKANLLCDQLIADRRTLHTMPEIAFGEVRTAGYIQSRLDEMGIEYKSGIAKTGILGIIRGAKPGKTVLLRADMDALPIHEQSGVAFSSQNEGMMHACGHDAHVSCLLGAANILNNMKDRIKGNIKLMFQPAEEGVGGAEPMILEGILQDPHVDAAFALHVEPGYECGKIAVKPGAIMAAPDEFTIHIKGKGGHGAYPHKAVDPILVAAKYIEAVQSINSRYINATTPAVVSVCMVSAGSLYNIIPDTVFLKGTTRAIDNETRSNLPKIMEQMLAGICAAMGAEYDFAFRYMYPPLINDEQMTNMVMDVASQAFGGQVVERLDAPSMGGEDFAYVVNKVPSSFFFLGCRNEQKGIVEPLHNPGFDIDEQCLPTGTAMMAMLALTYLEKP